MEEDNAVDMHKFVSSRQRESTTMLVTFNDLKFEATIRSLGNILTVQATCEPIEPYVFVMERFHIRKETDLGEGDHILYPFSIVFQEESLTLHACSNQDREQWMIKLATCSHQMAQAEMDEVAYKLFTIQVSDASPDESSLGTSFQNFFLTNPHSVAHNFTLSSQMNLPSRRIPYLEVMWESKLSIMLPLELVKLYRKWAADFISILESRRNSFPSKDVPGLHDLLRQIRENSETYEQCYEFLQNYSGGSFRPSVEKLRVAFAPVPTNLHVQYFSVKGEKASCAVTAGTASCLPLRFTNGGLHRIYNAMNLNPGWSEMIFNLKRHELLDVKRLIGEMSHRLDTEWQPKISSKPDKFCIELTTSIKQISERLKDVITSIPDADECAERLYEAHTARFANGFKSDSCVVDGLRNQLDALEVMLISLDTKVAVIDSLDANVPERNVYVQNVRDAMCSCLDSLLVLADTLVETQLYGFVCALGELQVTKYFHAQIRLDFVLSQAITIAATSILMRVQQGWTMVNGKPLPPLLMLFSWMSAYGDEKGMIEDAIEAWKALEHRVTFCLIRAPSAVCRTCTPIVSGHRARIKVSLPLPHETFDSLDGQITRPEGWKVSAAYWNIGVNHEASLAQQWGGIPFESYVNTSALQKVQDYSRLIPTLDTSAKEALTELTNTVHTDPSRKNLSIFEWSMAVCQQFGGTPIIGCKSGKDRTAMGVTLEQGRLLRETHGLSQAEVAELVMSLRQHGVRRENCRKNVGKAAYAFSPFQIHFLPKQFRPPAGTSSHNVAT